MQFAYPGAENRSYGNLPLPRQCGGCGAPSPCGGFVGSYVPPKYLARPCNPVFCSGYPEGPGSCYVKKAPYPSGLAESSTYAQEGYGGEYAQVAPGYGNGFAPMQANADRGIDSSQLFEGNTCALGGCDGFDDIYVDFCRDVAYSDNLLSDYTNVLSQTKNQVRDIRGPVDCAAGSCGGCPMAYFEGLYGRNDGTYQENNPPVPGASLGTINNNYSSGNVAYRTFSY